jgi:hypothetical protein
MTTALEGVRGERHAPAVFTPGKDPLPIVLEAGWAPGPVWTGAENLAPTGIRSPDRPIPTSLPGPHTVHKPSCKISGLIFMKLDISREIFEKYSNIKFHENPSSGSRVLPCRQTEDGQTNIMKLMVASCNLANAPQRVSNTIFRAN